MTGSPATSDGAYHVLSHHEVFHGMIFSVVTDRVRLADGTAVQRDYVRNLGAVVVAAVDEQERVVLVQQYRHAVRQLLWELPAGLLDVPGEQPLAAAQRELAEEVDLTAAHWDVLAELHTSPGFSTESVRIYLARDLAAIPAAQRHQRVEEEAQLQVVRVPLTEAVTMVGRGELTNAAAVCGVLAAARAHEHGWTGLRPPDTPWPPAAG